VIYSSRNRFNKLGTKLQEQKLHLLGATVMRVLRNTTAYILRQQIEIVRWIRLRRGAWNEHVTKIIG